MGSGQQTGSKTMCRSPSKSLQTGLFASAQVAKYVPRSEKELPAGRWVSDDHRPVEMMVQLLSTGDRIPRSFPSGVHAGCGESGAP
jgi:hypothetical protein